MRTKLSLIAGTIGLMFAIPQLSDAHEHHHGAHVNMDANRPAPLTDSSVYQLGSLWADQSGAKVSLDRFRGKPLVLAMAYTSCQSACPILVSDMKRIEQSLPSSLKNKVQFALFSFDSKKDTPETLRAYAKQHELDLRSWTFLTSNKDAVRELAAVLGVRYKQDENGEFSHSNVITVLNPEGDIVHQQVGLRANPKELIDALSKSGK